jgi:acyl-CoA thioesterase-1
MAEQNTYLREVIDLLQVHWPNNRMINVVCHGHSVPAGYFATPVVNTFGSYPHLLHAGIKGRFPGAVVNVIVTAIGGENSVSGSSRFEAEVLCHRPDVVTIDYGLNDRGVGLEKAQECWRSMIEKAGKAGARVILLTPTTDSTQRAGAPDEERLPLQQHAAQIRRLAAEYDVALVDSLALFEKYATEQGNVSDLMSWSNHPNEAGHQIVARELLRWFNYF